MNFIIAMVVIVAAAGAALYFWSNNDGESQGLNESYSITTNETGNTGANTSNTTNTPGTSSSVILDFSSQGLTRAPMSIFDATDTEVLDLSHNNLSGALQAEVRHLNNLRVLDLSDNNFTGVPAEVGKLSKLETLDLSNNPITGLPYEIGNLKNLKVLDLRGTSYSEADLEIIKQGLSSDVEIRTN